MCAALAAHQLKEEAAGHDELNRLACELAGSCMDMRGRRDRIRAGPVGPPSGSAHCF